MAFVDNPSVSKLPEVEAALLAHPGVRQAAAVVLDADGSRRQEPVAYVVPDENYIARGLTTTENQQERLRKWSKTFDLSQLGKQAASSQPGFNIAGWNSSYTKAPIPPEQMREWIDFTVQEIRSFRPQDILEIGCGTGLLLLRIARDSARYVGTDFAPVVLKRLKKQMADMEGDWSGVTLLERSAENFEGIADASFDTVILNSVLQYFPGASYLSRVLEGACRAMKPGGRIFVGDAYNLVLLDVFALSVELHRASPDMSLAELRQRAAHRVQFEDQLFVSPAFFLALQCQIPAISRVEIQPKRGRFDNELTRFRFNATLHIGEPPKETVEPPSWLDWSREPLTLEGIAERLRSHKPETLGIKEIANTRVERDVRALARIAASDGVETVGDLQNEISRQPLAGIDPQSLWSLAEECGYQAHISWAACRSDGSYDAVLRRSTASREAQGAPIAWPMPDLPSSSLAHHANTPGQAVQRQKLIEELLDHCKSRIPEGPLPTTVILLDALPLTPDATIDYAALRKPDTGN